MRYSKFTALLTLIAFMMTVLELPAGGYTFSQTRKESPQDFNEFLDSCTLTEKIQMLQALKDLPKLKDKYFGKLKGLPALDKFTTDKDKATPSKPLKPSTFNEVLPETVIDAMWEGIIDLEDLSASAVRKALVWRAYNKTTYLFRGDKEVDYHGIVQWVAEKSEVDEQQVKNLPTLALENKIAEKYFQAIWDKLTYAQRLEVLKNIEKDSGVNLNAKAVASMSGAAVIALWSSVMLSSITIGGYSIPIFLIVIGYTQTVLTWAASTFLGVTLTTGKIGIGYLILGGPWGWAIAAGLAGVGAFFMGSAEKETVSAFIMTVGIIKAQKFAK